MKKRIASMLAATVLLLSVIALPASAQTDWFGNSDLTTAKVREIADADTLTESQIAEINNHYSEYEIMQGISKTLIEDYAARINPDNPPHCAVCAGFDDLWLHYINDVYRRLGYVGSNYDIQRGYVDTGKTTELVDDQGFRWEASVYFVVDEDTYNENLQKMFRAEQALYDTYERILNNFGLAE